MLTFIVGTTLLACVLAAVIGLVLKVGTWAEQRQPLKKTLLRLLA